MKSDMHLAVFYVSLFFLAILALALVGYLIQGYLERRRYRGRLAIPQPPPRPPAVVVLLLLGLSACANPYVRALGQCGIREAPGALQDGVAVALRSGEGWETALGGLVLRFSDCLVRAEVLRHAMGDGPEPPAAKASAICAPESAPNGCAPGGPPPVSREESVNRAHRWLGSPR